MKENEGDETADDVTLAANMAMRRLIGKVEFERAP
jgi:hypothetical protein